MDKILIIIVVVTVVAYWLFKNKLPEGAHEPFDPNILPNLTNGEGGFNWDPLWVGNRSLDCYKLDKRDCMKYSNCGLCVKDGKMECIPGDTQGPLFKEDCHGWMHTNYYDRYAFGERVTTISPPWSMFYPDYEARYPSPQSRATL